jgi:hypothetical protein
MLDLNRNIKATVGNLSIPTRLFGPRELYGSKIITHFDTTDYKNYSLTTLTYVPIPQTGRTVIQAMFDISPQRRRYNYTDTASQALNISESSNAWVRISATSVNQFSGSSFDTNKGTLGVGGANASSLIELFTPFSGTRDIAPNSAVTIGFYSFLNQIIPVHVGIGPNRGAAAPSQVLNFGFTYTGTSATNTQNSAAFFARTGTTNTSVRVSNIKSMTPYINSYQMFLFTITGNSYYWYMNNELFDSGTIGVGIVAPNLFYPFTGFTASTGNYFSIEGILQGNTNTCEGFIASEYTTSEQVALLNDYFITKFKNKRGSTTNRYR